MTRGTSSTYKSCQNDIRTIEQTVSMIQSVERKIDTTRDEREVVVLGAVQFQGRGGLHTVCELAVTCAEERQMFHQVGLADNSPLVERCPTGHEMSTGPDS